MINAERIAIYIDRKSFNRSYSEFGFSLENSLIPMYFWKSFNEKVLSIYYDLFKEKESKYLKNDSLLMLHQGTWLFVSERTDFLSKSSIEPSELKKEKEFIKFM